MSFFGKSKTEVKGNFEMGGGDIAPIPDNTTCTGLIESANWDEYQGHRTIKLTWQVVAPAAFKNRKVFQKLDVLANDEKKADKARAMLAAIDFNAGGKLLESDQMPEDLMLMKCLVNKVMQIKVKVWEMNDKKGNWICAVSAKGASDAVVADVVAPASSIKDGDIPW